MGISTRALLDQGPLSPHQPTVHRQLLRDLYASRAKPTFGASRDFAQRAPSPRLKIAFYLLGARKTRDMRRAFPVHRLRLAPFGPRDVVAFVLIVVAASNGIVARKLWAVPVSYESSYYVCAIALWYCRILVSCVLVRVMGGHLGCGLCHARSRACGRLGAMAGPRGGRGV